jgi:hypothetical protein
MLSAAALIIGGAPASAPAATKRSTHRASQRRRSHADSPQYINAHVNALLRQLSVAQKFGQLEMSGPQGPNGTAGATLLNEARAGTVGPAVPIAGAHVAVALRNEDHGAPPARGCDMPGGLPVVRVRRFELVRS